MYTSLARLVRPALLLAVVLLCQGSLWALDPARSLTQSIHRIWQVQQGLPQGTIFCVRQSRDGYIWLGTRTGLVRFDGVQFTNSHDLVAEIPANLWVRDLFEDFEGTLWVATERDGLLRIVDGRVRAFGVGDGLPSVNVNTVRADSDHRLWVGTDEGLARFHGGKFETFDTGATNLRAVRAIAASADRTLWIGGDSNALLAIQGDQVVRHPLESLPAATSVHALSFARDGGLWIGTSQGLVYIRDGLERRYTTADGLSDNAINCLMEASQGGLWIGTNDGFSRLREGSFENFTPREGLSQSTVYSVCEDHEGSLWVGTKFGLNQFIDRRTTPLMTTEGLPSNNAGPIAQDSAGTIWVGTLDAGLARYDGRRFSTITKAAGLASNTIYALATGSDEQLWVGTDSGLTLLAHGKVVATWTTNQGLPGDEILSLCRDRTGTLWVGTNQGLAAWRDDKFVPISGGLNALPFSILAIIELSDGTIVAAVEDQGLFRVVADGLELFHPVIPSQATVSSLYVDEHGTLFVGTHGDGLYVVEKGATHHVSVRDGLYDDDIFGTEADENGRLWMACSKGIFSLLATDLAALTQGRISTLATEPFSPLDALRTVECQSEAQPAVQKMRDGRIWFATVRGVLVVDPAHWQRHLPPTPVVVEEIIINGKGDDPRKFNRIPPGPANVSLRYAALSYTSPTRISFRYKLKGFDPDWIEAGSRREAFYTNLPAGRYRFLVTARNVDDKSYDQSFPVEFEIAPLLYQTAWFLPLCALLLGAAIWAAYRLRVRQIRQRLAVVLQERSRIARELHDTLMQGFSGITMEMQALSTRLAPSSERNALEEIIGDAGMCLREARRSIAGLRGDRSGLPVAIAQAARQLTEAREIQLRLHLDGPPLPLSQETEYNLLRIAQEAITNAVKHSGGRFVDVSLETRPRELRLTIRDDGAGFLVDDGQPVGQGHYGLVGMRERAAQIGAQLFVESRVGHGTIVRVVLLTEPATMETAV